MLHRCRIIATIITITIPITITTTITGGTITIGATDQR